MAKGSASSVALAFWARATWSRLLLPLDVSISRAVAGFARDTEVCHARLEPLRCLVGPWLWAGGMAADAVHVPVLLADDRVRVADEEAVARRPALVVDEPSEGKADLQIAFHAGQPKNLNVV